MDDDGQALTRYEYLPYGETWFEEGEDNHNPKYNSQELDKETGYYFYNARYYDPEVGRFVTADIIIPGENSTQSWNRFSYVFNNPILYKDPTGHNPFAIAVLIYVAKELYDVFTTPIVTEDYEKTKDGKWVKSNTGDTDEEYAKEILKSRAIGGVLKGTTKTANNALEKYSEKSIRKIRKGINKSN